MSHPLRCRCGALQGQVDHPEWANHGVCYCRDCRAFAHFLGGADAILDAQGGTEILATLPHRVRFSAGTEHLACISLTSAGLLRWYAACCRTPIGNTSRNPRVAFVGLVHSALGPSSPGLERAFGPIRMHAHAGSARSSVPAMRWRTLSSVLPFLGSVLRARLDGRWRRTPFFVADQDRPVSAPLVLTPAERERLMRLV